MCKVNYLCEGGPFHKNTIRLSIGVYETLVFTLNNQRGKYVRQGDKMVWRDVPDDVREKEG